MEEKVNTPQVIVDAPENTVVTVRVGEPGEEEKVEALDAEALPEETPEEAPEEGAPIEVEPVLVDDPNLPKVVVEGPQGVTVEVYYGEAPDLLEKENLVVKEAEEEEAPVEEEAAPVEEEAAPAEETPAEEAPAEEKAEPERIYASDEEVQARINELEEANTNLRNEEAALKEEYAKLRKEKPGALYQELRESIQATLAIAETYEGIEKDFYASVKEYNKAYGEVDFLLAYLKSKKEAR